ncbi:glycosyltransferase [Reichenbachiella carrageenanivorans]|uniref:Glycosyltransferase n=1 Tax=Reichenbachiella carrageenanivorans TaxID=2979869 RepID=A0ABY6CZI6_9BACT|nr:glycosyltransferase [Reichenbachiella carrageenanivorans]UXX78198.1 glycosyltransferase [Reichenbachiella carrageenanivorans]
MSASNLYLERYAYQQKYLAASDYGQPDLIVVLPCHNEPDLQTSLEALAACDPPKGEVAVIVVINASQASTKEVKQHNEQTLAACQSWVSAQSDRYTFHFILENELPKKHAGVGLARKIGMDEAVRMFDAQGQDGVILCFDADSTCEPNLLTEVERLFDENPKTPGCSIHFEHPLEGTLVDEVYAGILSYELHLRYYVDGLKYAAFPYAFQTIGSSMAVRSSAYQKQGGMNRRKAGEDFYFLHKIIPLGNFKELNTTKIIPSPRRSDRVPFGTGRAIGTWLDEGKSELLSYDPQVFEVLKNFFATVDPLYQSKETEFVWNHYPQSIQQFIPLVEFRPQINEFNAQANSLATFQKRFYQWFDGFKALKFVHFARDKFYPNVPIAEGVDWLFETLGKNSQPWDLKRKLVELRVEDKTHS